MADPIARAIDVFARLKSLDMQDNQLERQKRLDEEASQDRRLNRKLATSQENRAQQSFDIDRQTAATQGERSRTEYRRKLSNWREGDVAKAKGQADEILRQFVSETQAQGKEDLQPEDVATLMSRLDPVKDQLRGKLAALYDAEKVDRQLAATEGLLRQLSTGEFDPDEGIKLANIAFEDELDARGQKNGAAKLRLASLVPTPDNKGLMFDADIMPERGEAYRAPLTQNAGTAEQGDNVVKQFKMEEIAPYLVGKLVTLQGAKAYLESLPDKRKREVMEVGSDKSGRKLVYKDTGEEVSTISKPIAEGDGTKSTPITLKTGQTVTLDDARQSYLATYGKPNEFGQLMLGAGAPAFTDWLNDQAAAPFFNVSKKSDTIDPTVMQLAQEAAAEEASGKAGWFSSDSEDFKESGGDRNAFIDRRAKEIYAEMTGQEIPDDAKPGKKNQPKKRTAESNGSPGDSRQSLDEIFQ